MLLRNALWATLLMLSVIALRHGTNGASIVSRMRRSESLVCGPDETHIYSANTTQTGSDCGVVVGQPPDLYNLAHRQECQRWLGLSDTPYMVKSSYVSYCVENSHGTVTYQSEICCPGVVTGLRCFACSEGYYHYQCNYDIGNVIQCGADEVCQTTYTFQDNYQDTVRLVSKSCQPSASCDAASADNTNTCADWLPTPSCSYCCQDSFCNYQPTEPFVWVADLPCVEPELCFNGATCVDVSATEYSCVCPAEYTGDRCQTPICDYGSILVEDKTHPGVFYCQCPPGRYGDKCQKKFCKNQGFWQQTSNTTYACYCPPGWSGHNCTDVVGECPSGTVFCQNGGTCMDYDIWGYRCVCPEGFVGHYCEEAVAECFDERSLLLLPMETGNIEFSNCTYYADSVSNRERYMTSPENMDMCKTYMVPVGGAQFEDNVHGSVTSLEKYFLETCTQGQIHAHKRSAMCCPTCYSLPCLNGGWCTQKGDGDYVCKCRFGYEGRHCEYKIIMCIISGDPHYYTFDGEDIRYQGVCRHTVAASADPALPQFTVTARNQHRDGNNEVSYPEYYEISVYGYLIRLDQNMVVYVDGGLVIPDVAYPGFSIGYNGRFVRLEADFGLAVEFDGRWTAVVKVPPSYGGITEGICGNNDGNPSNDLVTKEGEDVSNNPMRYSLIGNSWQVDDPSDPECTSVEQPEPPECEEPLASEIAGADYCGPMLDPAGPFAACLADPAMDPTNYNEACQFDVCANQNDSDAMDDAVCGSAEAMALNCASLGYVIDWRAALDCELDCPLGMTYQYEVPACPATCQNPDGPEQCHLPDTESCVCPGTSVLSEESCINATLCGCYDQDGNHYEIGDEWLSEDCLTKYTCEVCDNCTRPVGHIVQTHHSCPPDATCVTSQGGASCVDTDNCEMNPCANGGVCTDLVNGFSCLCAAGYTGTTCETDIDNCEMNPCANGGVCTDLVNGFSCLCSEGYTGTTCETDIDNCEMNPCANGGVCTDLVNGFSCLCAAGYTGTTCETDIDNCEMNPCANGGVCTDLVYGFSCLCAAGYTGTTCETDIDNCEMNPCANGGVCTDLVYGFSCLCSAGYTGTTCETDIDNCEMNPCANGGVCTDLVNGFSCLCAAGYTGTTCETDIEHCEVNPCADGGVCTHLVNGFFCLCATGYTGATLKNYYIQLISDIDNCEMNPCANGGVCTDLVNGFSCLCVAGYTGTTCETNFDECASSPCQNGGVCADAVNAFTCNCPAGFTGDRCQEASLDCATCDFNNNVGYLADPAYCGCYYRCLRTGLGQYHHYPRECCPTGLFWNPAALTCDHPQNVDTTGCDTSPANTPPPPASSTGPPQSWTCTYGEDPNDPQKYQVPSGNDWITMDCGAGMVWNQDKCTCTGTGTGSCEADFLLYFPFDDNFNDVSCVGAISDVINGPTLNWDAKKTKSAHFANGAYLTVGYLSNWFSGETITGWTVSVWFKLPGATQGLEGLVNNGNCNNEPSFSLYLEAGNVLKGSIDTVNGPPVVVGGTTVDAYAWNHVALVYDGQGAALYTNGALVDQTSVSGGMQNTQCPMNIAHEGTSQHTGYFTGFMDEVKLFDRALAANEVTDLYQHP